MTITDWITAIASLIYALTTLVLVIFAFKEWQGIKDQIKEASKARTVSVLLSINDIMHNLRPYWHKLYGLPNNLEQWTSADRKLADHVGAELQRVAYLVEKGLVDPEFVFGDYAKVFVQCWHKLEPYIFEYRISKGEPTSVKQGAFQRRHLENFSRKCSDYLISKGFTISQHGLLEPKSGDFSNKSEETTLVISPNNKGSIHIKN